MFQGIMLFEGEFLNGLRNGNGIEYYCSIPRKSILFEGEYLDGLKNKGREYRKGKLEFKGEYLFGKKWAGKGYDENGNVVYELNNGSGTIKEYDRWGELVYEGGYLNGERNGKGKEYDYGRLKYEVKY